MFSSKTNRWCAFFASLLLITWMGNYWFFQTTTPIYPYEADLDRAHVVEIFKQNYFWLTTDPDEKSAVDYFEWQLDTCSSSHRLWDRGNLKIYVYRVDGIARAFITYHPVSRSEARILYIGVDDNFRRKGYAEALMRFALDDLKQSGFTKVELLTRLANERAMGLYKKFGFKESRREDPLIYFERNL